MPKSSAFLALALLGMLSSSCGEDSSDLVCGAGTEMTEGQCLPSPDICGPTTRFDPETGLCEATTSCARGTALVGEECVPDGSLICESGTTYNAEAGTCDPDIAGCGAGTVLVDTSCVGLDEALMASQQEGPEPNLFGLAGEISIPPITSTRTVHGCIVPIDADGEGSIDPDVDSYLLHAEGPTLLSISVDGLGGLAGAFRVLAADGPVAEDGWQRIGLNMVGDTSSRQVFLPAAGDYFLEIQDGRSLLQNVPVGSASTCYFASIKTKSLPAAVPVASASNGQLGGNAIVLSYDPLADGDYIDSSLSAISNSAEPALVYMREGQYAGSAQEGSTLASRVGGLHDAGNLLIIVEPLFNYSLDPVSYDFSLSATSVPQLINGSATTIASGSAPAQEMAWLEAGPGDLIRLRVSDSSLSLFSMDRNLTGTQTNLCAGCADTELFYQATSAGIVYLGISDGAAVATFEASIDISHRQVDDIAVDSPITAQALSDDGNDFLELREEALDWNLLSAVPTGFAGPLELSRYPRGQSGFLDLEIEAVAVDSFSGSESTAQILEVPRTSLLRVRDSAFDDTADTELYDLSVSSRSFTVLAPGPGSPVTESSIPIDEGAQAFFWIEASPGQRLELSALVVQVADLVIETLDASESVLSASDQNGAEGNESLSLFVPAAGFVPLSVRSLSGTGSYNLQARIVEPDETSFGPGNESTAVGGGSIVQEASVAGACTIESLRLDLEVRGGNIDLMQIALTSPTGTVLQLHELSGEGQDLIGSYPGTLEPAQSLDAFVGEEAQGQWSLSLVASDFSKSLVSWSISTYCAEP